MDKAKENIKLLIENKMVSVWSPETRTEKENYKVTTENLIDFIMDNFTIKRQGMDNIIAINKNKI